MMFSSKKIEKVFVNNKPRNIHKDTNISMIKSQGNIANPTIIHNVKTHIETKFTNISKQPFLEVIFHLH